MAAALLPSWLIDHAPAMPEPLTVETQLLRRFVAGDDLAFTELVGRYQQLAYVVACRITCRDDLALDVVQEAFLRCLRHRDRFDPDKAFKPWLLQIIRHLAIDALRIQRRIDAGTSANADLERAATTGDPGSALDAQDVRSRVASVLASLPEKYRDLLIMREMEGQAAEDIARETGIDYGTTRWRLHEARRLFRTAWVARFGEGFDHA
jgi:RNA polymerase sigma-70 factor, ECF subfamily